MSICANCKYFANCGDDDRTEYCHGFEATESEVYDDNKDYTFTCEDCPYHYYDEDEGFETCHYNGEDNYAPCSYGEPEEVDWSQYE